MHFLGEEAKLGCISNADVFGSAATAGVHLGEVFYESSEAGAAAMDISPENFCQLLSRAGEICINS